MSPALKTSLFVSVALAAFAGSAQAGGYKGLPLGSPLLGSAYDEMSTDLRRATPTSPRSPRPPRRRWSSSKTRMSLRRFSATTTSSPVP